MWDPEFFDKLFETFDDLLFSAFVSNLLLKTADSAFLSLLDDWVEFFDPHDFVLDWEGFKVDDIDAGMDVKADGIVDGDMDVDELEGDGALDLFTFFRAVVNVGLIEDKVVLFPVE